MFENKFFMRKKSLFFVLLLIAVNVMEAKQIKEGIDISSIHSNIQNSSEPRSEAISADITGHTLTITFNDNVGIA